MGGRRVIKRAVVVVAVVASLVGMTAVPAIAGTCVRVPGSYQVVFCVD